jgi:hypothetical protein
MPTPKLTTEIINAAILGFEQQKLRIDAQISELRAMLTGGSAAPVSTTEPPRGKRRKMSAAGRKAIAEAQRKRWAASKNESETQSKTATAKPKRRLSAAGRAAIVAALKKRWAVKKAVNSKAKPAAKKAGAKKAVAKKTAVNSAGTAQ